MAAAVRDQRIAGTPVTAYPSPDFPDNSNDFSRWPNSTVWPARAGDVPADDLNLGLCGLRFGECAALRVRSVDLLRRGFG